MAITKTKAATEAHIRLVRRDPDFIKALNILAPCTELSAECLYNKYGIELDDLDCVLPKLLSPYNVFPAGYLRYNNEEHEFVATFSDDIKKEQFNELWVLIQKNREKDNIPRTKKKPPQEDVLLYAIFKARMAGMSFREIFEFYSKDTLLSYEGKSNSQFHSEDELEKYYRKYYKPEL